MSKRYDELDILIGKTVTAVRMDDAKTSISFDCDGSVWSWSAEGDCCSSTWIEHIEGVGRLVGGTVRAVEDIDLPEPTPAENEGRDVLQKYGVRIDTDKGTAVIDYRNESNGYYGGSLRRTDGDNPINVTEDF